MDMQDYLKFLFALIFVLCLMGGLAFALKKFGLVRGALVNGGTRRLKILEILPVDARRKLALIRCDDKDHLVLLGQSGDTVIQTSIPVADHDQKNKTA